MGKLLHTCVIVIRNETRPKRKIPVEIPMDNLHSRGRVDF